MTRAGFRSVIIRDLLAAEASAARVPTARADGGLPADEMAFRLAADIAGAARGRRQRAATVTPAARRTAASPPAASNAPPERPVAGTLRFPVEEGRDYLAAEAVAAAGRVAQGQRAGALVPLQGAVVLAAGLADRADPLVADLAGDQGLFPLLLAVRAAAQARVPVPERRALALGRAVLERDEDSVKAYQGDWRGECLGLLAPRYGRVLLPMLLRKRENDDALQQFAELMARGRYIGSIAAWWPEDVTDALLRRSDVFVDKAPIVQGIVVAANRTPARALTCLLRFAADPDGIPPWQVAKAVISLSIPEDIVDQQEAALRRLAAVVAGYLDRTDDNSRSLPLYAVRGFARIGMLRPGALGRGDIVQLVTYCRTHLPPRGARRAARGRARAALALLEQVAVHPRMDSEAQALADTVLALLDDHGEWPVYATADVLAALCSLRKRDDLPPAQIENLKPASVPDYVPGSREPSELSPAQIDGLQRGLWTIVWHELEGEDTPASADDEAGKRIAITRSIYPRRALPSRVALGDDGDAPIEEVVALAIAGEPRADALAALEALAAEYPLEGLPFFVAHAAATDWDPRRRVDQALERLIAELSDEDARTVRALMDPRTADQALHSMLFSDLQDRVHAILRFTSKGSPLQQALVGLAEAYPDEVADVLRNGVSVDGVPVRLQAHPSASVRLAAAEGAAILGRAEPAAALPVLAELEDDGDRGVRRSARAAQERLLQLHGKGAAMAGRLASLGVLGDRGYQAVGRGMPIEFVITLGQFAGRLASFESRVIDVVSWTPSLHFLPERVRRILRPALALPRAILTLVILRLLRLVLLFPLLLVAVVVAVTIQALSRLRRAARWIGSGVASMGRWFFRRDRGAAA